MPVLAGAGGYDTKEVMHAAREMQAAGAQGLLSVTPYYNKPTPEGLYQHFKAVADATPLPIVLYNVPGPHRLQHRRGDVRAAGDDSDDCRRERSVGQYPADGRDLQAPCRRTSSCCLATMR